MPPGDLIFQRRTTIVSGGFEEASFCPRSGGLLMRFQGKTSPKLRGRITRLNFAPLLNYDFFRFKLYRRFDFAINHDLT